jgi:hypothetical protein
MYSAPVFTADDAAGLVGAQSARSSFQRKLESILTSLAYAPERLRGPSQVVSNS